MVGQSSNYTDHRSLSNVMVQLNSGLISSCCVVCVSTYRLHERNTVMHLCTLNPLWFRAGTKLSDTCVRQYLVDASNAFWTRLSFHFLSVIHKHFSKVPQSPPSTPMSCYISRLLEPIIRCFFRCHSYHLYPPHQPIFALPTFYHTFY